MNFEFNNNVPIYVQIVEQLKIHIISGKMQSGERLPSVRDLALQLKVNPNTVQKALQELEEMKLIYTERTNGKFVTTDKKLIEKYKNKFAKESVNKYFKSMNKLGFSNEEAIKYLKGDK